MPSPMFSFRLNLERDRAYNAAAKAAKMELYEWVRMVCDEASGLTATTETQRPLDPKGPDPVAVPIKQRKKREKVAKDDSVHFLRVHSLGILACGAEYLSRHRITENLADITCEGCLAAMEHAQSVKDFAKATAPSSQPRQYTGVTKVWNGITMYEYGKGRWTKEPPKK